MPPIVCPEKNRKLLSPLSASPKNISVPSRWLSTKEMELSNDDVKEPSLKEQRASGEEKDLIFRLPDSVLIHILSFLPTMEAVKTTLVRGFGTLWREVGVLDFDECLFHDCPNFNYLEDEPLSLSKAKFMNLIGHVLNLCQRKTLDKFRLRIYFSIKYSRVEMFAHNPNFDEYKFQEGSMANYIEAVVHNVINKKVKVIDLDFCGCRFVNNPLECYILPDIVLKGDCLTELRLSNCEIGSCGEVNLKLLKYMSLEEVVLSDKMMASLLKGSPMLESLSLTNCYNMEKLDCTNPRLKKLKLSVWPSGMIVSCAHVLSLDIAGCFEFVNLVNVSSVLDANLFFNKDFFFSFLLNEGKGFNGKKIGHHGVKELFQKLSHCKTFRPCTSCILIFTIWELTNEPCPSFCWENLVLKLGLSKWHHPGISLLLRSSQCLETLTMYIDPEWEYSFQGKWIEAYNFDGENYWNSQEATFSHLKTVMIYGYITEPYVIQMVKFLLKNAVVLEKMVISIKKTARKGEYMFADAIKRPKDHFNSEVLLEFSQQLLSFPRASTKAVIHFN